jgi:hypothetical protein
LCARTNTQLRRAAILSQSLPKQKSLASLALKNPTKIVAQKKCELMRLKKQKETPLVFRSVLPDLHLTLYSALLLS